MFGGPNTSTQGVWKPRASSLISIAVIVIHIMTAKSNSSNTTHRPSTPHPTPQNSSLSTPKKIRYPINIQKRNTPKTLTQQNKRNVYILRMISVCVFLCFSPFFLRNHKLKKAKGRGNFMSSLEVAEESSAIPLPTMKPWILRNSKSINASNKTLPKDPGVS